MNAKSFLDQAAILLVTASAAFAEPSVVMRDAATNEQLMHAMQTSQQADPMKNLQVSKLEDPSLNQPKDLISQSDFISISGSATLVPKHAIVKVPAAYADRISIPEGASILGWADFFAANRRWITTLEITPEQAEGKEPLSAESADLISKSSNLIVATYKGGPISLLPPKPAAETVSLKP
jgi:hypothetical protein